MPRPLPSLNALRAFEAAARLHSFAKAADELGLTPSAVSHKIRGLEDYYRAALFRRERGGVAMTAPAAKLLEPLRAALRLIADAGDQIAPPPQRLVITAPPCLAGRWLLPRLGAFLDFHPGIDFQLHTTADLIDLEAHDIEFGLRYGRGDWPGLAQEKLLDETLQPVAAPAYVARLGLDDASDLAKASLLIALESPWTEWLERAGLADRPLRFGEAFGDPSLVLQAAEVGRGVALAPSLLAADALAEGRLATIGDVRIPAGCAYYLVWPERRPLRRLARCFRRWLSDTAAEAAGENGRSCATRLPDDRDDPERRLIQLAGSTLRDQYPALPAEPRGSAGPGRKDVA